jgi:hypothetical protein
MEGACRPLMHKYTNTFQFTVNGPNPVIRMFPVLFDTLPFLSGSRYNSFFWTELNTEAEPPIFIFILQERPIWNQYWRPFLHTTKYFKGRIRIRIHDFKKSWSDTKWTESRTLLIVLKPFLSHHIFCYLAQLIQLRHYEIIYNFPISSSKSLFLNSFSRHLSLYVLSSWTFLAC